MSPVADYARMVRAARTHVDRLAGEARAVGVAGKHAVAMRDDLRASLEQHERVVALLTRTGEELQDTAQRQIEELVTRGLQVIFSPDISFHLVPSVKAGQANLDFMIRTLFDHPPGAGPDGVAPDGKGGGTYGPYYVDTPVMEARGGGMAAVTGFLLRLVVLLLTPEARARRLLVLDESFGMVSSEYEPRVAEFLREVADKAEVQILLITHSHAYSDAADKSYTLSLGEDGTTEVSAG